MAELVIPHTFTDGETISGVKLDANFAAITTLVNTTLLDKDNLRPLAGLSNDQKQSPNALAALVWAIPQLSQAAASTVTLKGLLAYPHYAQYPIAPVDKSGQDGAITTANSTGIETFQLAAIQGCYHSSGGGWGAGDSLTANVVTRNRLTNTTTTSSLVVANNATGDNAIQSSTPALSGLDYLHLDLVMVTTGANRVLYNVLVIVWVYLPHVR